MSFFAVLNTDFKVLESKKSCLREHDLASKTHSFFFLIYFTIQSVKVLKTVIFKDKMSHEERGREGSKVPKKCQVLFEWPLRLSSAYCNKISMLCYIH